MGQFDVGVGKRFRRGGVLQGAARQTGIVGQLKQRLDHLVVVAGDLPQAGRNLISADAAFVGGAEIGNHTGVVS